MNRRSHSRAARLVAAVVAGTTATALWTSSATAADSVWWTNDLPYTIGWAALDGSGGADFTAADLLLTRPRGLAFDAAAGRLYWSEDVPARLGWANLDGSATGTLAVPGVTLGSPHGLAIDPAAGRLYVANTGLDRISYVALDGSGGGDLATPGATLSGPTGLAIDPAAGRIYWANFNAEKISWARLDGSGGGDVNTAGAKVGRPSAVAVDAAAGRIYWSGIGTRTSPGDTIGYARLDGTGGANLNTSGARVVGPEGVALDPDGGRIYWGNSDEEVGVSYARLDGTGGGGQLPPDGASARSPLFVAVLRAPKNTKAPTVTGSAKVGSTLSCADGTWAGDDLPALLYRVPARLTYGWSRNGSLLPGQTSRTLQTAQAGSYRCIVTATNAAGATRQPSAAVIVRHRRRETRPRGPSS
jgi:DNA-binding beta-propeller fold protein YncE